MPLPTDEAQKVTEYCWKHLPNLSWHKGLFNFITNTALRDKLAYEYRSARYIYKLGEALRAKDESLYGHAKYQILQYASIYEAVIGYLLWEKFQDHEEVQKIQNSRKLQIVHNMPENALWKTSKRSERIYLCTKPEIKLNPVDIKFDSKVEAVVKIGLIEVALGKDIKKIYKDRNGMHIESALKNNIDYDLDLAKIAYRRMYPFTRQIKSYFEHGKITDDIKIKNLKGSKIPNEARI